MDTSDFAVRLADKSIAQLKDGTSPWQKPWTDAQVFGSYNPTTGNRYRGVNIVALMATDFTELAVDADSQHRTLSHRYPCDVESFDATKTQDHFARMIQALSDFPIILVDFPAQATNFLCLRPNTSVCLNSSSVPGSARRCLFSPRTIQLPKNPPLKRSVSLAMQPIICWLKIPQNTKAMSSCARRSSNG
jgi:hypothetical protein